MLNKDGSATHNISKLSHELEEEWPSIIDSILREAERRYRVCCAADDFRIRACSDFEIVFGERNRVEWTARHGFRADFGYCTDKFRQLWKHNGFG